MNRRIFISTLLAVTISAVSPTVAQERVVADKIVAVVGNSAILYSEIDELGNQLVQQRREQGYTTDRNPKSEALEKLLLQKLLYNQALIDSVKINTDDIVEAVDKQVAQMIEQEGSLTRLETMYHKPIFDIREDLRTQIEESRYAQMMQYTVTDKVAVTPGEVERFYKKIDKDSLPIIPEQYIYAQITRFPASTKEAKQRVRERLLEMRERILGGMRFDALARMYSEDTGSAARGGEMEFMPLEGFVKPFADALEKLKVDQISEIVETEYGFHIIQLLEVKGNLYRCRHILLRPIFTSDEMAAGDTLLDSLARVIRLDSVTFERAAIQYSDDKYSKQNGGRVTNHEMLELYGANDTSYSTTKFLKEELSKDDYNALRNLKVGEISKAFQSADLKGNVLSKIVRLEEIVPAHKASLNNDYLRMEQLALQRKQQTEFEKWVDKKIEAMYIRIDSEYGSDFENKNWIK